MLEDLSHQHVLEILHEYNKEMGSDNAIAKSLQDNPKYAEKWLHGFAKRIEETIYKSGRDAAKMHAQRAKASAERAESVRKEADLIRALAFERYVDQSVQRQTIEWVSGTELSVWPVEGVVDPGAKAYLRRRDTDFFVISPDRESLTDQTPVTVKFIREDNAGPAFIQFEDMAGATWKLDDDPVGPDPEEAEQEDTAPDDEAVFGPVAVEDGDQSQTDEPEAVEDADVTRAVETNEEPESPDDDKPA